MPIRRLVAAARHRIVELGLGVDAIVALCAGAVALLVSALVFAGATEDVTRHNGLALHDAARLRLFVDSRDAFVVNASKVASYVGAVPAVGVLAVLAGLLFWWRGLRLAVAFAPVASLGVAAVAVAVVKTIVGRGRPPVALHLVSESDASFPSGHATNSTAVFITIALVVAVFVARRPLVRVVSVAGAALASMAVGASRLVLGVHWPSDVLAGLALGGAIVLLAGAFRADTPA